MVGQKHSKYIILVYLKRKPATPPAIDEQSVEAADLDIDELNIIILSNKKVILYNM